MKFAIISAGEGSRLAQEGVGLPKPLVQLDGKAMIDRLVDVFERNGAEQIVVIINEEQRLTREHMNAVAESGRVPIEVVVKSTPSSMHSFYELSPWLEGDKFCLTTVDTVFHEDEFAEYVRAFQASDVDGLMAVTDYVDDEKPLYVATDPELTITGFYDEPREDCRYVSGGIYCLSPRTIETLRRCVGEGMARMRNFQRALVADGLRLKAYPFKKILDVDHAADIAVAEAFLREEGK